MFYSFTEKFGKPVCVILYAAFAALAVKITWIPLAALALMHFCEYIIIGYKTAKRNNIGFLTGIINCLAFGFTWWLPIKRSSDK